ncbi:MAG TPA: hypothetical protein VH277_03325 [Gemmatimonadaceae bacterium]|jgi:hypothetical protein|nr:hypothetical protein [Gemmatimonadaceae bacterium]
MPGAKILILAAAFVGGAAGAARAQKPAPAPAADSMRMAGMADHAMDDMHGAGMDVNMAKHMELTPERAATHEDSVRALKVAAELKRAIAKYQDTTAAVADGYHMFLPNVKQQRVYHFTNTGRAFKEAFRFNPAEPTSLLYKRGTDGKLHLLGAMYTMPRRASMDRLNDRVPLGIARWHKHVSWCLPKKGESERFSERTADGKPKFGPESAIATKAACDAVDGEFHPTLFGWMLHANVFEGTELGTIFGEEH